MKTIKTVLLAFSGMLIITTSCNKENPIDPVAEFTTSLTDNTAYANEPFYIFLDQTQGDFLTIFAGTSVINRYDPDNGTARGEKVDIENDSIEFDYDSQGTYRLTLVATSSGNWSEDFLVDTFGYDITVIDRTATFDFIEINNRVGIESADGSEINFFSHKSADLTALVPEFRTTSDDAVVTIDGVVQVSKSSVVDFSALNPNDDEGRPVVYRITPPSGDFAEYTVKFILDDSRTGKQLFTFDTDFGPYTLTAEDESDKVVPVFFPIETDSADLVDIEAIATASEGAMVWVDDEDGEPQDIADNDEDVDLLSGTVTVQAEDGMTQDYDLILYPVEMLESVKLVESDGTPLFPSVDGIIEEGTVTFKVLAGTNLTSLVVEYSGFTDNTLFLGDTELESGVTADDYSANPVFNQKAPDGRTVMSYPVVFEEITK